MPTLSICIPVYNQNVTSLLEELIRQQNEANENVEILVFEDGSASHMKKYNAWLRDVPGLIYQDFKKNKGRAAIRNRLAQAAGGDFLLFLDDDSLPLTQSFVQTYLDNRRKGEVCCGGRVYEDQAPGKDRILHWTYGRITESRSAEQRGLSPHESFHSNNFMISRPVFMGQPFDESLKKYGHEDTLFGFELKRNHVPLRHIENPVVHSRLETNSEFLEKSQMALDNLHRLYLRKDEEFNESVKLLRAFGKLKNTGSVGLMAGLFRLMSPHLEQYLLFTSRPSLKVFNFYKLGYLAQCHRASTKGGS